MPLPIFVTRIVALFLAVSLGPNKCLTLRICLINVCWMISWILQVIIKMGFHNLLLLGDNLSLWKCKQCWVLSPRSLAKLSEQDCKINLLSNDHLFSSLYKSLMRPPSSHSSSILPIKSAKTLKESNMERHIFMSPEGQRKFTLRGSLEGIPLLLLISTNSTLSSCLLQVCPQIFPELFL